MPADSETENGPTRVSLRAAGTVGFSTESLILAQDERWRRA